MALSSLQTAHPFGPTIINQARQWLERTDTAEASCVRTSIYDGPFYDGSSHKNENQMSSDGLNMNMLPPHSQEPHMPFARNCTSMKGVKTRKQIPNKSRTRVHKCDECSYETFYTTNLIKHKRVHSGDYFQCPLCPSKYSDKGQLSYHMMGHAGALSCNICGKKYVSVSGLYHHRKLHHSVSSGT